MDFLDPKKQRVHTIRLLIGYVLIGVLLIVATTILLYRAYGFGIKNGEVIQNGLVFVSSTPNPAEITINGKKYKDQTNARISIEAGQYTFELKRDGYRPWKRAVTVEGGVVLRFDYPFLVPERLTPANVKRYETQPGLATQSPDRRWLLVQNGSSFTAFDAFDLNDPQADPRTLQVPGDILTSADEGRRWELVEWSTDNRHVVLKHHYSKDGQQQYEYILVDREEQSESLNLTRTLGVNPTTLELRDKAYDEYYLHDQATGLLSTATLRRPEPVPYLQHVLAFKTHGTDMVLYATSQGAPSGKINVKLRQGDDTYTVRQLAAGTSYLLDLARFDDAWYVVAGSQSEGRAYVYKNPIDQLRRESTRVLAPVQVLKVANMSHVSFSANARFAMAQSGGSFAVYDAKNDKGYAYQLKTSFDQPQAHASWMDGHRLSFVSDGKAVMMEFDNANQEVLVSASPAYTPFYDRDYELLYTLVPQVVQAEDGTQKTQFTLTSTSLRTAADR